ncbi:uncharacterized protein LOC141599495 [Silene latifolia]|uniref:uncharacterized protein LOC141599495 n=1 Tax=Silene latifolia TaxID=37657 RepID=UPI003D77CFC5
MFNTLKQLNQANQQGLRKSRRKVMSLSLIQGYSSAEEDEQHNPQHTLHHHDSFSDEDDDDDDNSNKNDAVSRFPTTYTPVVPPQSSNGSLLPSALDVFSEVSGPPQFLNNCVEDQSLGRDGVVHHRGRNRSRGKKDLPSGVVVEAKAQLVGIHERVRSDVGGNAPSTASSLPPKATASNSAQPSMCLQCGIPKMYSSALGMVCPTCPSGDAKKKGSTVKDKEKSKRMKGQSSHASWKSETEMQLRQTFD